MANCFSTGALVRLIVGCEIEPGLDPEDFVGGTPVGTVGRVYGIGWYFPDDVLVDFGGTVFQCGPDWLEPA